MRLILARLLWNFDIKLDNSTRDWLEKRDHQAFAVWQKPALNVLLTPKKTQAPDAQNICGMITEGQLLVLPALCKINGSPVTAPWADEWIIMAD